MYEIPKSTARIVSTWTNQLLAFMRHIQISILIFLEILQCNEFHLIDSYFQKPSQSVPCTVTNRQELN